MSVFHLHEVKCACGNSLFVQLADSINVKRSPAFRDKILHGELHRFTCPQCGRQMVTEKLLNYVDFTHQSFFKVLPRGDRHKWKTESQSLDNIDYLVPETLIESQKRELRVLFGMDELREKLVIQDAGMDDRVVELLKVLLVYEHPILVQKARLRLVLDEVTDEALEFTAVYENDPQKFRLKFPRWIVDDLIENTVQLRKWVKYAHPKDNFFELEDHWVSMQRLSTHNAALARLEDYAERVRRGGTISIDSPEYRQMREYLPRGNNLPAWAKKDLRTLFEFAKDSINQELQDDLFEIRFGIDLKDEWSTNADLGDINTLWQLLRDLPDTNVEGNTEIAQIRLGVGDKTSFYNSELDIISISSQILSDQDVFEDTVRHEVGHAVHDLKSSLVDDWLESQFGWLTFGVSDDEIDQWVNLMGGWGTPKPVEIRQMRRHLRTVLGPGDSLKPPSPIPVLPDGHPWNEEDFGPRLATEKTGANWYENFDKWHRFDGKAFFLNYSYQQFMVVNETALDLVAQMPDPYAAMSNFEFFAELYALYYDLDDPKRSVIPPDIRAWLESNIGAAT